MKIFLSPYPTILLYAFSLAGVSFSSHDDRPDRYCHPKKSDNYLTSKR